jgi:hypothetical protein
MPVQFLPTNRPCWATTASSGGRLMLAAVLPLSQQDPTVRLLMLLDGVLDASMLTVL